MKVLLVKTSSMGDVIHTFPAVTDALSAVAGLQLDWCVEKPFAGLVRLHPGVGTIHEVELRRWRRQVASPRTWHELRDLARRLKEERYDLVIDAQGLMKSVFVARMAGVPIAGFDRATVREPLSARFYRHAYHVPRDLHAIVRTRMLLGAALGYEPDLERPENGITPPPAAGPAPEGDTVFLLHGTSSEAKKWQLTRWFVTAEMLAARGFTPVTTWSTPREREDAEAIAARVPSTRVLPKTTLEEVAAEIGRASLVIGTDTGLTHLAAAFGLPTVAVFVATRPGLTGVRGPKAVSLTPRMADGGIDASAVIAAADEVLGRSG